MEFEELSDPSLIVRVAYKSVHVKELIFMGSWNFLGLPSKIIELAVNPWLYDVVARS